MAMDSIKKNKTYKEYKEKVIKLLVENRTWKENGVWKHKGKITPKSHILPLRDNINSPKNRAEAIKKCIDFDCTPYFSKGFRGLHPYAHHLTSSQSLCLQFFANLIDQNLCATEGMVEFIKKGFGIDIHVGATCTFEYVEKIQPYLFDADKDGNIIPGYEGTSFDFHIKDDMVEIYFEIKFTEQGFKKEKSDQRHLAKARRYLDPKVAPQFLRNLLSEPQDFLNQYQIYRNIIRAKENSEKYVVFISDGNNPETNSDKEMMENLNLPKNVMFKTWQELTTRELYPFELPFQLKAIQNYK